MARNGSGTMTVLNSFSSGTKISSSATNANNSDIAAEITNSLAKDGQTIASAPIKFASGTAAAPGITFGSDTDCGFYRIGGDNIGGAVAGAKVLDISATGLAVTGALSATGGLTMGGTPVGSLMDYAGSSAPTGWLLCYGQAISRSTYSALFTAISTVYGIGDGSTTFNLPDCRGRTAAGKDDMGGSSANRLTNQTGGLNGDTLGATGGAETQTLLQTHLPDITFNDTLDLSTNVVNNVTENTQVVQSGSGATMTVDLNVSIVNPTVTGSVTSGGSDTPHNNVQPTIVFNKIIYTGVA